MKYRITKIEMRDDNHVIVYMKLSEKRGFAAPKVEEVFSDPFRLVEFSKQIGNACVNSIVDDAYITLDYAQYSELELKVGDYVELEIKPYGEV